MLVAQWVKRRVSCITLLFSGCDSNPLADFFFAMTKMGNIVYSVREIPKIMTDENVLGVQTAVGKIISHPGWLRPPFG